MNTLIKCWICRVGQRHGDWEAHVKKCLKRSSPLHAAKKKKKKLDAQALIEAEIAKEQKAWETYLKREPGTLTYYKDFPERLKNLTPENILTIKKNLFGMGYFFRLDEEKREKAAAKRRRNKC